MIIFVRCKHTRCRNMAVLKVFILLIKTERECFLLFKKKTKFQHFIPVKFVVLKSYNNLILS